MGDDREFKAWMDRVDKVLEVATGLTSADLPDFLWRDKYEDGVSPGTAAADFMIEEDMDC